VQQGIAARVKTGTGTKDISDVRTTLSVDGYCGSSMTVGAWHSPILISVSGKTSVG